MKPLACRAVLMIAVATVTFIVMLSAISLAGGSETDYGFGNINTVNGFR